MNSKYYFPPDNIDFLIKFEARHPKPPRQMYEHFFQCPYCWEEISMILDPSISSQTYIEDCEVCCNPIEVYSQFEEGELVGFEARDIEQ